MAHACRSMARLTPVGCTKHRSPPCSGTTRGTPVRSNDTIAHQGFLMRGPPGGLLSPTCDGLAKRDAYRKRLTEQGVVSHQKGAYRRCMEGKLYLQHRSFFMFRPVDPNIC